jgi:hypothetical protein
MEELNDLPKSWTGSARREGCDESPSQARQPAVGLAEGDSGALDCLRNGSFAGEEGGRKCSIRHD